MRVTEDPRGSSGAGAREDVRCRDRVGEGASLAPFPVRLLQPSARFVDMPQTVMCHGQNGHIGVVIGPINIYHRCVCQGHRLLQPTGAIMGKGSDVLSKSPSRAGSQALSQSRGQAEPGTYCPEDLSPAACLAHMTSCPGSTSASLSKARVQV